MFHAALYIAHLAPVAKEYFSVSFIDKILSSQVSVSLFLISEEDKNIVQVKLIFFFNKKTVFLSLSTSTTA